MTKVPEYKRLGQAVFFVTLAVTCLTVMVPLKWVGLVCGLLGSVALLVPVTRHELIKLNRHRLQQATPRSIELQHLRDDIGIALQESVHRWHPFDSAALVAGTSFLTASFVLEMVHRATAFPA